MKIEKPEKVIGYALLVIGLIFIVLAAILAYLLFASRAQIPQFVPVSTEGGDEFAKAFTNFSNVCLVFFIFIVIIWAGSIISKRGMTLIKEMKLKIVEKNPSEEVEIVRKAKAEKE